MPKRWQIHEPVPAAFIEALAGEPSVVAQLLYNRGIRNEADIARFLHPELNPVDYDAFRFRFMEAAVDLIISHIKAGSKIVICGDYDADGVTSSALLEHVLRTLKANVEVWIPSRFGQGYGLNQEIISELATRGVKLIITVDNGIRAKAEVASARALGIDVLVTDHHEGPSLVSDLPECIIIDPILEEETYPFKYLCGAGVAFKVATALISRSTLSEDDKARLEEAVIDLAAIGTISDCVSLLGENRLLVKRGLKAVNEKPRLGVRELMEVAKIKDGEVSEWNISWQITPRLNVAGRLDHANTAYRLLATNDRAEARAIAAELNEKNIERQKMTEDIVTACAEIVEREQVDEKLLILVSPELRGEAGSWSEGVIGLVAGRLCERFSRPCFVITKSEGKVKGSGRSIEQFDIGSSLDIGKESLERYGGHKAACGFTLKSEAHLAAFMEAMRTFAQEKLGSVDLSPVLHLDGELPLLAITDSLIEELEKFVPYGQNNPEPKFATFNAVIEDVMTMGQDKKHIKFRLGGMWALAFGRAEEYKAYRIGQRIDVAYTLCFNIFNGRRDAQLKIIDLRPSNPNE